MRMRLFLIKGICFAAPLLVVLGYFEIELRKVPTSYSIKRAQLAGALDRVEVLVEGPSHTEQGVFPRLLRRPAYSLAFGGQDLYYDSALVERHLDGARRLRVVIITVSYISFEYRMADAIEPWRTHFYSIFFHIPNESLRLGSSLDDKSLLVFYGPEKALEYARKHFAVDLSGGDLDADGSRHVRGALGAGSAERNGQLRFEQDRSDIMHAAHFEENRAVLEELIARLQARGVTPVLITLPVLPSYGRRAKLTPSWQRMQDAVAALSRRYGVRYFNYFDDARFGVSDFANSDHLNESGAVKLTNIIDGDIIGPLYIERR